MFSLIIGCFGVGLLLVAFGLNLLKKVTEKSPSYLIMNIIGSLMAAWYAFDGRIIPFVILELIWALAAFIRLVSVMKKGSPIS
ncbi:MAG: hypothetical protein GXO93_03910 [FCB group bacterium]|nr:hypothetical protein [FCB group bacterium]